ncbi:unnamed protein product [Phytomonas sp. Hart1]|nr:unnamed protein product [Phytomonas sp. Hart1]|eukprot:CCW67284.1 unnamed protein product [Phytomonas sp. isolate Hart1]
MIASDQECYICQEGIQDDTIHFCVCCSRVVCSRCTQIIFYNRYRAVLCNKCPTPKLTHPCGRCGFLIPLFELAFFCSMCAMPLCTGCLSFSFENGSLKCSQCCDTPVCWKLPNSKTSYQLNEHFLKRLQKAQKTMMIPFQETNTHPASSILLKSAFEGNTSSEYTHLYNKQKLGEGAQGVVYKCCTVYNKTVVSKEMVFDEADRLVMESRVSQALRIKTLRHPHLISYLDVILREDPLSICVIMPYYDKGDLREYITRQRAPVKECVLCSIALQIGLALKYLHTQNPPLVHRDIKPENVLLLDNEEQVLLMDLDLCGAADLVCSMSNRKVPSSTYEYQAPELVDMVGSTKSDVFSLGVMMFVLATLPEFPCVRSENGDYMVLSAPEWTPQALGMVIRRELRQVKNHEYSELFIQLLVDMLNHDPAHRPTSTQVCNTLAEIMEQRLMQGELLCPLS